MAKVTVTNISMVFNEETKRKEVKTTEDLLQILKDGLKKRWETSQHAAGVRANAKSKKKKVEESAPPAQPSEKVFLRECPIVHLYIRDQHQGEKEVLKIAKFSDYAEFHFLGDRLVARPKRQRPPLRGKVTTATWKTTEDRFGRVFNKTTEKIGFNATNLPERPANGNEEEVNEDDDLGQLNEEGSSTNQSSSTNASSPISPTSGTQSSQGSGKKRSANTEGAPTKKAKTTTDPKKPKGGAAGKKPKATKSKWKAAAAKKAKKAPAPKKAPASKQDDVSKNAPVSKKDGTFTGKRSADTILSSSAEPHEAVAMASLDAQSNMEPSTSIVSSTPDSSPKRARTRSVSLVSPQTSTSGKIKNTKTTKTNKKSTQPSEKDVTSSNNHTDDNAEMDVIHTLSIMSAAAQSRLAQNGDSNTTQSSFNNKRSHSTAFINSKTQDGLESVPPKKKKAQRTSTSKKQNKNADKEGEGMDIADDSGLAMDSEMTDVEDEPVEMEWEV
jgi:hypothetical protein